jgi:hypothetical protein
MEKPLVIMEWMPLWTTSWHGKWEKYFPEAEYGTTQVDTHIYDFKDTVAEEEAAWGIHWKKAAKIAKEVPLMLGEYTLAMNKDLPTSEAQGWATYVQENARQSNMLGTAEWTWTADEHKFWSMRSMSNLVLEDGIDWPKAFAVSDIFMQ